MSQPKEPILTADRIGLNFIRPDAGRPGYHDFVNSGEWIVSQYVKLGVTWNRLAFSWVAIQPDRETFDWAPYDRVVDACERADIQILATLGGHFDRPPVPAWAGDSLQTVVNEHPEYLERFVEALVRRYQARIRFWEILNEPGFHHNGLTVLEYAEKILRPSYRIVKAVNPELRVLCCAYNNLPLAGNRGDFWDASRGCYDIGNHHQYQHWGYFMTRASGEDDENDVRAYRADMEKYGEGDKPFWITETGWWGTGSLTGSMYEMCRKFPQRQDMPGPQPSYTGREMLEHPVVAHEDALRAVWMKDWFARLSTIPGCEKAFLWASMDEFEGGYSPDRRYGRQEGTEHMGQVDLWGIIAGDRSWRKSAFVLQETLRRKRP